jgi:hypothetical protein
MRAPHRAQNVVSPRFRATQPYQRLCCLSACEQSQLSISESPAPLKQGLRRVLSFRIIGAKHRAVLILAPDASAERPTLNFNVRFAILGRFS